MEENFVEPVSTRTEVDLTVFSRKKMYDYFLEKDNPFFSLTIHLDITDFSEYQKKRTLPFFLSFTFLLQKAFNEIEELKYRICEEGLFLYDVIHPAFTVASKDDSFTFCDGVFNHDFDAFLKENNPRLEKAKQGEDLIQDDRNRMFYISVLPWLSFTSVEHPRNSKYDSVPIITIGKYFEENGKVKLPFALEVHHSLADGYHVGLLVQKLEAYLNKESLALIF